MTAHPSAAKLFKARLNKTTLRNTFDEFIADGASVGRDGVKLDAFKNRLDEEINIILRKVKACSFEFTSYKEKLMSKGAGKAPRQVSIPTIRDKLVLKFLSELLAEIYPDQRPPLPHTIIRRVHEVSRTRPDTDYYLRLDVKNYYPSIDHKILMRIIRRRIRTKPIVHLIENAIKTPTGKPKAAENLNVRGVPQGLSISNILAFIYLVDIDNQLSNDPIIDYFRYVDDILLVAGPERVDLMEKTVPLLLRQRRKLKCHPVGKSAKSIKVKLIEGIEYLGYRFCGDSIEVRSSSLKKMFENVMKIVTGLKYKKDKWQRIWRLNLRISGCQLNGRRIGWLFFFSQSKNLKQLKHLDAFVAKHAGKVLPSTDLTSLKRFVKAYHEIKFNMAKTKYFPNFDAFDSEQKKAQIKVLQPKTTDEKLEALSPKQLDDLFHKCIRREVADLETDMMEVFS